MAKKKTEVQLKFEANTAEFNTSIKKMNSDINLLNNQLKLNATQLKGNSDNLDLLNQRQDLLTIELQKSSQKVDDTNNKLNEAKKLFGDNSQEVRNLTNDLLRAQNQEQAIRNELDSVNNKIDNVTNSMKENETEVEESLNAYDKLTKEISIQEQELQELKKTYSNSILELGETATETQELKQKLSNLNNELAENKTKLSNVDKASSDVANSFDDLDDACDDVDGGFTIMKGALADLTSNVIQGAISGISGLVSSLFDLSEATEEYRSMSAKLEGSASSFGYSVDFANEQYKEFYSYLGDSQMATNAITNLMGLGLETNKVSSLAEGAIGVWASYGDSIPIESLTESINETIQVGKVTGTMADTINWAKVSNEDFARALGDGSVAQKAFNKAIKDGEATEDAFSAALAATSDTQERANIVASFLNSTYGESKTTYDNMTEGIRDANTAEAELMDVQSEMANAMDPINNAFINFKVGALEALLPVVENLSSKFLDFKGYLEEHEGVATVLKGVVIGLAVGFGILATALGIQSLIKGVTTAISLLNATMAANPIVLVVAAIAGLVAAFVYLWNNCESFRNFWIDLWDGIVSFFTDAKDKVVVGFTSIVDFVKGNWQGILTFITNPFVGAFKLLYDNCDSFRNKVDELKNKVVGIFSGIANTLKNVFKFDISLPKIKLPHFSITPKGWGMGDLMKGKIPKLSVSWYAKGAVFTKPTIFNTNNGSKGVAEAGSEAVLPLSILDEKIQNSMALVLDNLTFDENVLGVDNIVSNNINDSMISSKLDRACELLEKIVDKDWSLYADTTEIAHAISSESDQISGEMIELRERGLEL